MKKSGIMCKYNNCSIYANFNYPTETTRLYCKQHALPNMIDISKSVCIENNCSSRSNFNYKEFNNPLYCSKHKKLNMANVTKPICTFEKCIFRASFGYNKNDKILYCSKHAASDMVNIKVTKCLYENCSITPGCNYPTETKRLYCSQHKLPGMISLLKKLCIINNCGKKAMFGNNNIKSYCSDHKTDDMVDLVHKHCIYEGCNLYPLYNLPEKTPGKYCINHKTNDMIDVKNKKCCYERCVSAPAYNYPTKKTRLYCKTHALPGMIDIKKNICQDISCINIPTHGYNTTLKKQFCKLHASKDMINLDFINKCSQENCDNEYNFIYQNKKYCLEHCPDKSYEISIKRMCKYCDMEDKSTYVCQECKQNSNKKEWAIVRHIKQNIHTYFLHNTSSMLNNCFKRRPDVYYECLTHDVIVEIDEHQHKRYDNSCECSRINEIINGIGGKSVIFIRYNPDTIKNKNKKITICKKDRLEQLIETINAELKANYDTFQVKIIQLYYDDNYEKYAPIKSEIITDKVSI